MSYIIAITGKGGCGKTTMAAMMVSSLVKSGRLPVLAVDADPNSCLDVMLGLKVNKSIGTIREDAREEAGKGKLTGISKQEMIEMKISESLVEADGFDLIAMGRPEGPGCYCYANNVLSDVIKKISKSYPYTVIDNEAGLENLSRRIVQKVDLLVMVGEPSSKGIETIMRLYDLAREMKIRYDKIAVIINRVRNKLDNDVLDRIKNHVRADFVLAIHHNDDAADWGEKGDSIINLPAGNEFFTAVDGFLKTALEGEKK
jgi:CO dehydrogenase maturation factor